MIYSASLGRTDLGVGFVAGFVSYILTHDVSPCHISLSISFCRSFKTVTNSLHSPPVVLLPIN